MKNIRQGVFETNSSSSHSISIGDKCTTYDTMHVDDDGVVTINGYFEFGWGYETYSDPEAKAAYLFIDNNHNNGSYRIEMLTKVIKEHTGACEVVYDVDGYIDHQSTGTSCICFDGENDFSNIKEFVFNPNSELIIDNDNH